MQSFTFQGPPGCALPLRIAQDSAGVIGCKLYPGALLLCQYLAHAPLPRGSAVLELGAGACGLPALWLSRCGCRVLATDVPAVLALLDANLAANGGGGGGGSDGGSLQCAPLQWGTEGAGGVAGVGALLQGLGQRLDYIVAADVVYHDEFIAPLLAALLQLTEPPPPAPPAEGAGAAPAAAPWAPPTILLSYVQRFKRARRFFKLAAAHFEVQVLAGAGRDRGAPPAAAASPPPPQAAPAACAAAAALTRLQYAPWLAMWHCRCGVATPPPAASTLGSAQVNVS
jgi:hypothetical protein